MQSELETPTRIGRKRNAVQEPTPPRKKFNAASTVERILDNPKYLGAYNQNPQWEEMSVNISQLPKVEYINVG